MLVEYVKVIFNTPLGASLAIHHLSSIQHARANGPSDQNTSATFKFQISPSPELSGFPSRCLLADKETIETRLA